MSRDWRRHGRPYDCLPALNLYRESGARRGEAHALTHLGDTPHSAGEIAQARQSWQQAMAILEDLRHPDAGQIRVRLS